MEKALLQAISEIIADKKQRNIAPLHAMNYEVLDKVTKALNDLEKQGKINVGDTINHKWITVNEKPTQNISNF